VLQGDGIEDYLEEASSRYGVATLLSEEDLLISGVTNFILSPKRIHARDRSVGLALITFGLIKAAPLARGVKDPEEQNRLLAIPLRNILFPRAELRFTGRAFEFLSITEYIENLLRTDQLTAVAA
jgi:hypothetical protein